MCKERKISAMIYKLILKTNGATFKIIWRTVDLILILKVSLIFLSLLHICFYPDLMDISRKPK